QEKDTADPDVDETRNNGEPNPKYRHDNPAEEVGNEFFDTIHVGRMDPDVDLIAVEARKDRLHVLEQGIERQTFFDDPILDGWPATGAKGSLNDLLRNWRGRANAVKV